MTKTAKWELSLNRGFIATPCSMNPVSIVKEGTLFAGTGGASRHGKTSSAQLVTPRTKYRAKRPWKKLRVLSIITTFLQGSFERFCSRPKKPNQKIFLVVLSRSNTLNRTREVIHPVYVAEIDVRVHSTTIKRQ